MCEVIKRVINLNWLLLAGVAAGSSVEKTKDKKFLRRRRLNYHLQRNNMECVKTYIFVDTSLEWDIRVRRITESMK